MVVVEKSCYHENSRRPSLAIAPSVATTTTTTTTTTTYFFY